MIYLLPNVLECCIVLKRIACYIEWDGEIKTEQEQFLPSFFVLNIYCSVGGTFAVGKERPICSQYNRELSTKSRISGFIKFVY